eukprot:m.902058 g.902058  ORF g.902058 m.902058 type:complete len:191 (-) comp23689_c3_seq23:1060-1632(-)
MWVWICYITHTETSFHALCVPCCCPHHLYATTNHPTATPPATPISIQECNTTVTVAPMHADTLKINPQAMRAALSTDMLATDLAYYLTRKAVPFREAHKLAGKAVAMAEEKDCALEDLTTNDYKSIHPKFDDDVAKVWDFENSTDQYTATGGTAKTAGTSSGARIPRRIDAVCLLPHMPRIFRAVHFASF